MTTVKLDQQRSDMLEALYQRTGLWEEFCRDIAANFRDTDYAELHGKVCRAMDDTDSVMTQKLAQQAIAVCRAQLLGRWG